MSMITVNRTETLISGSLNGNPFSVTYDEKKYALMKEIEKKATSVDTVAEMLELIEEFTPLTKESYKEIIETASEFLFVNKHTNKYYLKYENVISSKEIPTILADKILYAAEKNIDITPIIKCWVRFLKNVNFTDHKAVNFAKYIDAKYVDEAKLAELVNKEGLSLSVAREKATVNQVAITLEGLIVGYKVSREITTKFVLDDDEEVTTKSRYTKSVDPDTGLVTYDTPEYVEERLFEPVCMGSRGDAFWCVGNDINSKPYSKEGHHIRVGASHFLDSWDKVDCNDSVSCVPGLHVGGLSYIKGYQHTDTVTHNVLIDPMDIGAVCDINGSFDGAMRVRRYFVHSSFAGVNKNIYHSSKYAAMNDEEYRDRVKEMVEKTKMKKEELDQQLDEAYSLT